MAAVALLDSGGANIGSLRFALQRLGAETHLTDDAREIRNASHVILPGVGAATAGMTRLRERSLVEVVRGLVQPVLGICLGMQLLFAHSEEGDTPCLGLLSGRVRRLDDAAVRVPHMGWNTLRVRRADPLLAGIDSGDFAYFVHSYAAPDCADALAASDHGGEFAAVVRRGNFCGAQFHPERSAGVGARLLKNFLDLPSC